MPKICLVGAGSTVFAQNILGDVLSSQGGSDYVISLFDIVARRICEALKLDKVRVEATLDRRAALRGSDFVILMMQVGGYKPATVTDFDVPKKYGLKQTIADTLGIGGIFRGLRTIPFMVDMASDMRELCPDALLLNYTNPMSILTQAVYEAFPEQKVVGLCHNVQNTAKDLAEYLDVTVVRLSYDCAGINHQTWFLKLRIDGEDAYPRLWQAMEDPQIFAKDKVRFEL